MFDNKKMWFATSGPNCRRCRETSVDHLLVSKGKPFGRAFLTHRVRRGKQATFPWWIMIGPVDALPLVLGGRPMYYLVMFICCTVLTSGFTISHMLHVRYIYLHLP